MRVYREVKVTDRLPIEDGEYYCIIKSGKCGNYYFDYGKFESSLVEYWLEPIELPSDEEIEQNRYCDKFLNYAYLDGVNDILNKIKS